MSSPGRLHRRERRPYPYYKLQVFAENLKVWRDQRGAFNSEEEAQEKLAKSFGGQNARIMVIFRDRRFPLGEEDPAASG